MAFIEVGVVAFELLFGGELGAEVGHAPPSATGAVLSRPILALEEGAFRASPEIHLKDGVQSCVWLEYGGSLVIPMVRGPTG